MEGQPEGIVVRLAPIDPQKDANDTNAWFVAHGWQIIAAIILCAVAIGLFRALPKWLFFIVAIILAAIVLGVSAK
jgi:hypothetical protein